jgi:hypothetical protein
MKLAAPLFSKTISRNLMLLAGMVVLLYASPSALAGLTSETHCEDLKIGPDRAWCIEIALCNPPAGDIRRWVFLWMSNNTTCPNNNPPVLNSTKIDGRVNDPRLVGTARSTTLPAINIVALGVTFAGCDGVDGSFVNYFFSNCNPIVYPPYPFPDLCYAPNCYPGQASGPCSFCSYNWTVNAQCQGPLHQGIVAVALLSRPKTRGRERL